MGRFGDLLGPHTKKKGPFVDVGLHGGKGLILFEKTIYENFHNDFAAAGSFVYSIN